MNQRMRAVLCRTCLLFGGMGCGHSRAERPPVLAPSAPVRPATAAAIVPHARAPADATTRLPIADESIEKEPVTSFMTDHFWVVVWARDAVVHGELEALRKPLRSLAAHAYESVAPASWMGSITQLQAAARATSEAENLTATAAGVAAMTRVCGQCHDEQKHRLQLRPVEVATKTPTSDDISMRMNRHAWASERLWQGLMAPSDQVWQAGAAALAHAPMKAPKLGATTPREFAQSLAKLRDLGLRATQATSAEERSNLYGLTLAACADCHADVAVAGF